MISQKTHFGKLCLLLLYYIILCICLRLLLAPTVLAADDLFVDLFNTINEYFIEDINETIVEVDVNYYLFQNIY